MFDFKENNELLGEDNKKRGRLKLIIIVFGLILIIGIILLIVFLTKGSNKEDKDNSETKFNKFIIKGTFIDTPTKDEFRIRKGCILVEEGLIKNFSLENPDNSLKLFDYSNKLIIPGLSDLHLHAPQYPNAGLGLDLELLQWLEKYTFPEESKYKEVAYAKKAYQVFVDDLTKSAITRASIFATLHTDITLLLMDLLEQKKFCAFVGKVGMDRNSPEFYTETNGKEETKKFLEECEKKNYTYVKPIITPRFTVSCTDDYMKYMGELAKEYNIPVQSHLSENLDEIELVKNLTGTKFYGESYDRYGLFGSETKTIMAHCVHSPEEEVNLIKKNGVYIAHCPTSNSNLASGISPAAKYLREGCNIGLGSDISGGHTLDLFEVMRHAIQVSKLNYRHIHQDQKPLTLSETFFMATNKGGSFFGKVGTFEKDYEFDAIVLDESLINNIGEYNEKERLEKFIYDKNGKIESKFIRGNKIF
jgi:guanine deaminase